MIRWWFTSNEPPVAMLWYLSTPVALLDEGKDKRRYQKRWQASDIEEETMQHSYTSTDRKKIW